MAPTPVSTGIGGLDQILCGGMRAHTCLLVEGVPGSGKTTLGMQFVYAGLVAGQPGLVVTFEEFPEDLYHDAEALGWDLREYERQGTLRVVCTSPQVFLDQLSEVGGIIDSAVTEIGARRMLLDSVSHFSQVTADPTRLRALTYSMLNGLRRARLTAVITKEVDSADPEEIPFEEYLVDAVVRLTHELGPDLRRRRFAEILKTRGQDHYEGKHALQTTPRGLVIYPRSRPRPTAPLGPVLGLEQISTGVPGLDEMLCGGLPRGFTALVAGSAGVGKTTLALQFLCRGAEAEERGLLVCFEETPDKLASTAASSGIPLPRHLERGMIEVLHRSPTGLLPGELLEEIGQRLAEQRFSRVVVDSLTDLGMSTRDEVDMREFLFGLQELAQDAGVTTLLTTEVPELFGQTYITSEHVSVMVDGIILLKYLEMESEIQRALSILKMRGCHHDHTIRRYELGAGGMRVLSRFEGAEGVMAGQARRTRVPLATRSFTDLDERLNVELLARFQAAYPHIEPVTLRLPQNPDEAMQAVVQALSAYPSTLTVVPIVQYWLPQLLGSGMLRPVDELVPVGQRDDYLDGLIAPAMHQGHLCAVPVLALAGIFFYRKDLLEKYGFSGPPQTWDELVLQAETVLAGERDPELRGFEFPSAHYEMLTGTFLSLLWSNGGEVLEAAGQVSLEGAAVTQTLQFMHTLVREKRVSPLEMLANGYGVHPEQHFVEGHAVFYFGIPDALPRIGELESPVRERVGIGLPPVGPAGTRPATLLGGWHYGIPRNATAPNAAGDFIRFMTSYEIQKERALRGQLLPSLPALYEDPELVAFHPYYTELPRILAAGRSRVDIPHYLDFSRLVRGVVHRMLSGDLTPAQAQEHLVGVADALPTT